MATWLGKAAVLWVLDEAQDVPAHLVSTLVAVARYADNEGRGAHPSALTVATHTRKTERQAKRDLAALEQLGLLLPGDTRIVARIRSDRRPNVYDLPMPRGDTHDTPRGTHGVTYRAARGDIQGQNGVSPMSPKEFQKNSRTRAPRARAVAPKTTLAAPPCPVCGLPFSAEILADPDVRALAMAGDLTHFNRECVDPACREGDHLKCPDSDGTHTGNEEADCWCVCHQICPECRSGDHRDCTALSQPCSCPVCVQRRRDQS